MIMRLGLFGTQPIYIYIYKYTSNDEQDNIYEYNIHINTYTRARARTYTYIHIVCLSIGSKCYMYSKNSIHLDHNELYNTIVYRYYIQPPPASKTHARATNIIII